MRPVEAAVFCLIVVTAVLQSAWMLTAHDVTPILDVPVRLQPEQLASKTVAIVVLLGASVLILMRRTRAAGLCAAAAVGALLAVDVANYDPRSYSPLLSAEEPWLFLSSMICAAVAGALAAARLARTQAAPDGSAPVPAAAPRIRAVVGVLGLIGAALFAVGGCLAVRGITTDVAGPMRPIVVRCCSFGQSNGYKQTADVLVPAVLLACVALAALSRSRTRSVTWLAAPALFLGNAVAEYAAEFLWPSQALTGIGRTDPYLGMSILPAPGYWLVTAGLVVLGLAAVLRARAAATAAGPYGAPLSAA